MYNQPPYKITGPNVTYSTPQQQVQTQQPRRFIPEAIIELKPEFASKIRQVVDNKEKMLYAGMIQKINQDEVTQDRIIIITDQHIYNVDPNDGFFSKMNLLCSSSGLVIKRKIQIPKVNAVTLSISQANIKQQFVIHVRDGHDYRYNGHFSRDKILKCLLQAHFIHTPEPLFLFCKEEADLKEFQTGMEDVLAKKTKQPKEVPIFVTPELAAKGINWIVANRIQILSSNSKPIIVPTQKTIHHPINFGSPSYSNYSTQAPPNNNNTYQPSFSNNSHGNYDGGQNIKPQFYVPEVANNQGNLQASAPQQGQGIGQYYAQPNFTQNQQKVYRPINFYPPK